MSWSLTTRLRWGFATAFLLVLGVTSAIWWITLEYSRDIRFAYDRILTTTVQLAQSQSALWELRFGLRQFTFAGPEEQQLILAEQRRLYATVEGQLAAYDLIVGSGDERRALAAVRSSYLRYKQARPKFFELWQAGEHDEAAAWAALTVTPFGEETIRALDTQIAMQRSIGKGEQADAVKDVRTALVVVSASTLALLVMLVIGYTYSVRLLRPIRALRAQAQGMVRENFGEAITASTSSDEVAALVESFQLMSDRLLARTESLRQSCERLDFLLRATPAVIYSAKASGDYAATFISGNVRAQLGYDPEEITGDPGFWASHIHAEDRERVFADLPALFATGEHVHEYRFRRKDGSWRWMHDELRVISDSFGAPRELVGYWLDITARKHAEEALRESEVRHKAIIESALDAIVVNDAEGRITAFNGAAEQTFGYRREQVIGRDLADLFIPQTDGEVLRRRFRESLASGTPEFGGRRVEVSALHADGHAFPIELAVQRIDRGGQMFFIAFVRDLTDVKRAEQTQARFASILDATPDFVGYADAADTHVIYINPAGRKMIGLGQEEDVTRLKIADVHPEWTNKLFRDEILPAAMRDGVWTGESAFLNRDGREIPVMMVLLAHRSPAGEVDMYSTISRDITERKRVEAAMAEALRAKSQFMANVTHELRTPLNAVIGFAELLKDEVPGPLNAKQAAFVADIVASGEHLLKLVGGILEMSRLDMAVAALQREPVEIGAVLEECMAAHRNAAEACGLTMRLDLAADAGHAELDPQALRRMLDALIDNAIKFNRAGGTVTVSAQRAGGAVKITVADTGIGIAPQDLPKLFQPLVQLDAALARKYGGIGLGLALAKRLAELHGGTIEVESQPGKGSTFTLRLPALEKS